MMTGTRSAMKDSSRRRDADARLYSVYYAVGFILFLPFVMVTRLLPRTAHRREIEASCGGRASILDQTRTEVNNVLAFVFMA